MKVMIAEDDNLLSTAYKMKFEKEGFEVRMASDGEEALQILKGYTPDIILLDIMMPRKNGLETLAELKQNGNSIPVVITTNLGQQSEIKIALDMGASDYVIKSEISIDGLVMKIKDKIQNLKKMD